MGTAPALRCRRRYYTARRVRFAPSIIQETRARMPDAVARQVAEQKDVAGGHGSPARTPPGSAASIPPAVRHRGGWGRSSYNGIPIP